MEALTVIIEKTNDGYSGYVSKEGVPVFATGDSISEIKEDIKIALEETGVQYESIDYAVDIEQFFDYYKVINKTTLADIIGVNPSNLRSYAKKSTYISSDRLGEISDGINRLGKELSSISLMR